MKLFVLIYLAFTLFSHCQSVYFATQNQPCNKDRDILLAEDPTGNPNAFLRCNGVGVGSIGFWERKFCPSNMQFDFINQQCKLYSNPTAASSSSSSSANSFNIAILNNSCAKGERCIGGTVCDLETLKCLCPYGTVAQLETLSCVRNNQTPFAQPEANPKPTPAFFGPVTNYKTGGGFNQNMNGYKNSFNQGLQQSSYNYVNSNGYNKPYVVPAPPQNVPSLFLPEAQPIQPTPALDEVAPGQSCRNGEKCGGGSECTYPMQLCLCPGELEEHGGKCVLPPGHQTPPTTTTVAPIVSKKVGIGALCNQFATCDYQSTCVNGRCQCLEPMTESEGRCVLKLVPKEVGPGELCDNGEICTKGSICDPTIPVCVCPEGTDLMDGFCVKMASTRGPEPTTYETFGVVNTVATATQQPFFPTLTSEQTYPTYPQTAAPTYPPTLPPTLIQATPGPVTRKPNHMKLQLGGGKQSGVGVQCRLNTDCMIGAYCNGNTSPPTCQCLSTHVNVNGRCQKVIYPGQVGCEHDLQCTTAYSGTSCIDRECVCPQGSKAIEQTCVSDFIYPGMVCVKHCAGDATCIHGRCQCVPPQVLFQKQCIHKERILMPKGLNHPCKAASHCPPDLLCLNGKCDCAEGFDRFNSLCVKKEATVTLKRQKRSLVCYPDQVQCDGGRGLCYSGECRCLDEFVMKDGKCRPRVAQVGENCDEEGIECVAGSKCSNGLCLCATQECLDRQMRITVETTTPCHNCNAAFVPINGHCSENDRCEGGSLCVGQTCTCTDGSVESYGRCRQRPGGRCSAGQSCSGGAHCELGACRCPDGKVIEGVKCVSKIVAPGKSCQSGETCANGARCRFGVCMCVAPYRIFEDRCEKPSHMVTNPTKKMSPPHRASMHTTVPTVVRVGPGQVCIDGQVCTGGSRCTGAYCTCKEDEIIIDDHCVGSDQQALQVIASTSNAAPGQTCQEGTVCTGGSVCLARICICPDNTDLSGGVCILNTQADSATRDHPRRLTMRRLCSQTTDCLNGQTCLRSVCRCKEDETMTPSGVCKRALYRIHPGGSCDDNKGQNCIGDAVCIQNKCVCPEPLVFGEVECASPYHVQLVSPGSACGVNRQCSGASSCLQGYCRCKADEVIDVNKKCVNKKTTVSFYAYPRRENDRIFQNLMQKGPDTNGGAYGASCQGSVCVCTAGYVYRNGQCELQKVGIDEPCHLSEQCPLGECVSGVCTCPGGKSCSRSRQQPQVVVAGPGEDCTRGQQCCANSYCGVLSGVCECTHGMTNVVGRCERASSPFGPQCATSSNCHKFAYCDNGYCICKAGYTFINNFCLPPAEPLTYTSTEEKKSTLGLGPFGKWPKQEETPNPTVFVSAPPSVASGLPAENAFASGPFENIGNAQNGFIQPNQVQAPVFQPTPTTFEPDSFNFVSGPTTTAPQNFFGSQNAFYPPNQAQSGYNFANVPENPASGATIFQSRPSGPLPDSNQGLFGSRPYGSYPTVPWAFGTKTADFSVALPGEFCGNGRVCIGNSQCHSSYCSCPEGTFLNNGVCGPQDHTRRHKNIRRYARPLENCENFELCTDHSECVFLDPIGHFCRCKKGYLYYRGRCTVARDTIEVIRLGAKCSEAQLCADGAECLQGKCSCPASYQELASYCLVLSQPGEACGEGQLCRGGSVCGDTVKACICPNGKELKQGSCEAMFKVHKIDARPGDECNEATVCVGESYCSVKGYCTCNQQALEVNGRCVPYERIRLPGEACQPEDVCSKSSSCEQGYCNCPRHTVARMGTCVRVKHAHAEGLTVRKIDETEECNPKCPDYGICTKSMCICKPNAPGEAVDCLHVIANSITCDCPQNTVCQRGFCVCLTPNTVSDGMCTNRSSTDLCNPETDDCEIVRPGSSCASGRQCGYGSKCVGGYCICEGRATVDGCETKVEKRVGVEEDSCSTSQDCLMELVCLEGVCTCLNTTACFGRVLRDDTVFTAPPGGSCSEIDECSGGSVCREGWCVCPDASMIVQRGICVQTQPTPTVPPKISQVPITDYSTPLATTTPKTLSSYNRGSLQVRQAAPGTNCGPLDECVGGSTCIEAYCICPAGTHASADSGRCEPSETSVTPPTTMQSTTPFTVLPDYGTTMEEEEIDECTSVGLICRGGTICIDLTCQCPNDFVLHNDQCVPPRAKRPFLKRRGKSWSPGVKYSRPNEPCARGETCTGGSICIDKKTCLCPPAAPILRDHACTASDEKPTQGRRTSGPGEQCDAETSCTEGSYCFNGLCRCQGGYISFSGRCIKLPSITGPSTVEPVTEVRIVQVGPEEQCGEGRECGGGSECDDDTELCQCPIGLEAIGGQCVRRTTTLPMTTSFVQVPSPSRSGQCSDDTQCGLNSNCVVGRCKCRPGYELSNSVCTLQEKPKIQLKLGDQCLTRTADLCPFNADCIHNLCVCQPGFYALNEDCVPGRPSEETARPPTTIKMRGRMRKYGSKCGKFDDCSGGADCVDGRCKCQPGHELIRGKCRIEALSKGISSAGADCSQGQVCSGGSVCDYNTRKCICAAGHTFKYGICRSNDGPELVPAGSACKIGDTCDAGLRCRRGICACSQGASLSDGYCRPENGDIRLSAGAGLQFSSRPSQDRLAAQECPSDPEKCKLPNCFCSKTGKTPPGNMEIEKVPQFVVLTFDDAVNVRTMRDYRRLFSTVRYRNPNGCPVKATFFVSHEWTNYDLVQWLSEDGHEIASNSITHVSLQDKGRTRWLNEMDGQRRILAKFGNVPEDQIVGMRSPQTTLGGDAHFEMMERAGFLYDNSVSANPAIHEAPYWPQTLDYRLSWNCTQVDCPNGTFPGVWEVPLGQIQGNYVREEDNFKTAAMLRGAVELNASESQIVNVLMTNFERAYHSNRAPFVLTLNADFLQLDDSTKGMDALEKFLDKMSAYKDVHFATLRQLIEWMRHPRPLEQMNQQRCPSSGAPKSQFACAKPNKCMYRTPHLNTPERQFETCNLCPDYYPWVGNPTGSIIY